MTRLLRTEGLFAARCYYLKSSWRPRRGYRDIDALLLLGGEGTDRFRTIRSAGSASGTSVIRLGFVNFDTILVVHALCTVPRAVCAVFSITVYKRKKIKGR